LDRGWAEIGASRLRTLDLACAGTDWLSEQVCQLVDGLSSSSGDAFATLAAERMLDRDERKPGDTERRELAPREPLEHRRADGRAGRSRLRQLDGVVETPRRAGSSVSRAGEDDVTVFRQARQDLGSGRRRGIGLAAPDHRFDAMLFGE